MQRIQSFDLARGLTVLFMPAIHVGMLYSKPHVQQSLLGDILVFIAEGPGAQLFMLLMGTAITFSSRINKKYALQRAIYFLLAAYALNFFKFIVPLTLGWMPENLLSELQLHNDHRSIPFFLLIGDILHFASFAYLITFFIYRLNHYPWWALLFASVIILLSPLLWDIKTGYALLDYVFELLGGHPPQVFFPIFPWLVYPLAGLAIGYFLKRYNINTVFKRAGIAGILLIMASCLFPASGPQQWLSFYRTGPADTLFHLGFVLAWLAIFQWLYQKIPFNPFFQLLTFCSEHITSIYIIQWILICWGMAYTGYLQLGFLSSVCWMAGITTATLLLAASIKHNYEKKLK